MLALIVATLLSASFALVVRYAQGRNRNLWSVGAINYTFASLFHAVRFLAGGWGAPAGTLAAAASAPTLILGFLGGTVFISTYALLLVVIRSRGVSISTAVSRLDRKSTRLNSSHRT